MSFIGEFYQTVKEELTFILFKIIQKIKEEEVIPELFYKANTKDTEKKLYTNIPDEYRCESLNKVLSLIQ